MDARIPRFRATVIVSVYKDTEKLGCILPALDRQSVSDFEIAISEDGESPEMARFVASRKHERLLHLTQPDQGFRKNRALNRAIRAARSDYFIFIDGDCVPHRLFVENHLHQTEARAVCSGRRIELGPAFSRELVKDPQRLEMLENPWFYLREAVPLHRDGIKNYEYGFVSERLQSWFGRKPLPLVGCNFSCGRAALETVNGFNEDYEGPGIGEDADLDWRLRTAGYRLKNIKFLAAVYHLWHPRNYEVSEVSRKRLAEERAVGASYCRHGLVRES